MNDPDRPREEADESPEALTRRLWLRTIGETAATLGLLDQLSLLAHGESPQPGGALPPGLYEPSRDHLSHAMMQQSRFHVIPPDCPTDYVRPLTGPFVPQFFSESDFAVIRRMTSLLLGASPSEGAVVEEVAEWIDLTTFSAKGAREAAAHLAPEHAAIIRAYYGGSKHEDDPAAPTPDPQQICRDGLRWISEQAQARYQNAFLKLTPTQQVDLLESASNDAADFFRLIKGEVIRGFYTSQAGLKEIDYKGNGFYAKSPGCH